MQIRVVRQEAHKDVGIAEFARASSAGLVVELGCRFGTGLWFLVWLASEGIRSATEIKARILTQRRVILIDVTGSEKLLLQTPV
jgi:hypothetical protein